LLRQKPLMPTVLSNGWKTAMIPVISEEGGSLSQGQKQLLSIARVMLCFAADAYFG